METVLKTEPWPVTCPPRTAQTCTRNDFPSFARRRTRGSASSVRELQRSWGSPGTALNESLLRRRRAEGADDGLIYKRGGSERTRSLSAVDILTLQENAVEIAPSVDDHRKREHVDEADRE